MQPQQQVAKLAQAAGLQVEAAESEADKSLRMAEIERFATIIKEKRKDAVEGRRQSGIEKIWAEDGDHYEGVDAFSKGSVITKPRTQEGTLLERKRSPAGRSTAFVNITRPYCDAAAARVGDVFMPTDQRNWSLENTPVPDHPGDALMGGEMPQEIIGQGNPAAMMAMPAPDIGSEDAIARAQLTIDDWLIESEYHAELRKVIGCCARLGVGILKGPHPARKKFRSARKTEMGWAVTMETKTSPVSIFVDPWNFYPDPNCGDDIQDGSYCMERGDLSARALRDLKGGDYLDDMIDLCLDEGPTVSGDGTQKRGAANGKRVSDKEMYSVWYFYGEVSKKDMLAAGCECDEEAVPAIVTMVNDRIIMITQSPLDSGEYPYDIMVWQQKIDHWAGLGVARQIRTPQKGLNGAVRALQDNSSISSGPQIIVDTSKLEPVDGKWTITPNKLWRTRLDAETSDVRAAFTIVSIETRQAELLNVINYWTRAAEEITNMPMLLQGQSGGAPETLGGMQIVNSNASAVLRLIARTFDTLLERHIGRYYEWLLLYGPEDAKGQFQVDARGSSALVERDIQNMAILRLLPVSKDPAFGLDPSSVMQEVLKSLRLNPTSLEPSEEKKKKMAEAVQPTPVQVEVARIRTSSSEKIAEMEVGHKSQLVQAQAFRDTNEAHYKSETLSLELRLAQLKFAHENGLSLEEAKVEMAKTTMELQTQKELAYNLGKVPQVAKDAVEPVGRAPHGAAFQR